ncbi:MAG: lysophospholipid acyltransferase family protein [Armatimonadetes bacterium]|nr:lysophospholipid acyltransferase family protein [Armatimonadota bacterium]
MRKWWRRVRPKVLQKVLHAVVRTLGKTWRVTVEGLDETLQKQGGKILLGWHGRTVVATKAFYKRGYWAIISLSNDGDMQNTIYQRLGFRTIRGSTGRGGERALVESIRILRQGDVMVLTPDGPRGPSGIVQLGSLMMARKSGAWLVPCGVSAKPAFFFKSWDKHMVPMPFAKCLMIFGPPYQIPADADEAKIEEVRLALERDMHALQTEADRRVGQRPR